MIIFIQLKWLKSALVNIGSNQGDPILSRVRVRGGSQTLTLLHVTCTTYKLVTSEKTNWFQLSAILFGSFYHTVWALKYFHLFNIVDIYFTNVNFPYSYVHEEESFFISNIWIFIKRIISFFMFDFSLNLAC